MSRANRIDNEMSPRTGNKSNSNSNSNSKSENLWWLEGDDEDNCKYYTNNTSRNINNAFIVDSNDSDDDSLYLEDKTTTTTTATTTSNNNTDVSRFQPLTVSMQEQQQQSRQQHTTTTTTTSSSSSSSSSYSSANAQPSWMKRMGSQIRTVSQSLSPARNARSSRNAAANDDTELVVDPSVIQIQHHQQQQPNHQRQHRRRSSSHRQSKSKTRTAPIVSTPPPPQQQQNDDDDSSIDSAVWQVIRAHEAEAAAAAAQFQASLGASQQLQSQPQPKDNNNNNPQAKPENARTTKSTEPNTLQNSMGLLWISTKDVVGKAAAKLTIIAKKDQSRQEDTEPTAAATSTSSSTRRSKTSKSQMHRASSSGSRTSQSTQSQSSSQGSYRRYTMKELLQSMEDYSMSNGAPGAAPTDLPPALERRVRDFRFAQSKRQERQGNDKPWGIFGLYAHLSDIRADLEWAEDAAWRRQKGEPYLSWTDFESSRDAGLHNRPWFTYGIIALCTLMFIVTFAVNGWRFEPLTVNPLIGPSSETLVRVGARQTDLIVNEGQWYRLFTPLVLHAGLIHFVINMMAVYFIGGALEQSHGFLHAAVLFCIPAVGGNILSAICLPQYISVGASGGIFGLIGGCLADICLNWNLLFWKSTTDEQDRGRHYKVLFWLAFDILINCVIGFTPFVDNFTHLGGFLYGLCCGLSTMDRLAVGFFGLQNTSKGSKQALWNSVMRFLGLIISVLSIMITTVILVQSDGTTSPCHGCRYISCVPFPPRAEDKWWYCDDCDFVVADLFRDDQTDQYTEIRLTCPDDQVEIIDVTPDQLFVKDEVRKSLPSYCRNYCEEVFSNH